MITFRTYALFAAPMAVAAVLIPVAVASAEPTGLLIETGCSYDQLTAALRVEMPQLAERLDGNANAQQKLRDFLDLSVDQRRDRVHGFLDRNPDVQRMIDEKRATPEGQDKVAKLNRIADTCPNY